MPTSAKQPQAGAAGGDPSHGEEAAPADGGVDAQDVTAAPAQDGSASALLAEAAAAEAASPPPAPPATEPARASIGEIALLKDLRDRRRELEEAEAANRRAQERLTAAREVYNHCAQLLAGYTPREARLRTQKRAEVRGGGHGGQATMPFDRPIVAAAAGNIAQSMNLEGPPPLAALAPPRGVRGQVLPDGEVALPTNDVYLPEPFDFGGGMSNATVATFRDAFYQRLTKGQSGAATIEEWHPPPNNANLKSRAQLEEWIHIATHWNTGADGLDPGAFRAKHKTWYSRMKPASSNLGRRTGIHLRQLSNGPYEGPEGNGGGGATVLCRYNKAGNKSIVYLEVGRLFDALFQIHALELGHRGRDATKNLADERYANVPDATVRAFLDSCPICVARRGGGQFQQQEEYEHMAG